MRCAGASAAEVIHSFDSTVEVAKDGTLTVIETIKVRAEGNAIRHGIFRAFPLTFTDKDGKLREVSLSIIGISRDGHAERYHTERRHGVVRIYAGGKSSSIRAASTFTSLVSHRAPGPLVRRQARA